MKDESHSKSRSDLYVNIIHGKYIVNIIYYGKNYKW